MHDASLRIPCVDSLLDYLSCTLPATPCLADANFAGVLLGTMGNLLWRQWVPIHFLPPYTGFEATAAYKATRSTSEFQAPWENIAT